MPLNIVDRRRPKEGLAEEYSEEFRCNITGVSEAELVEFRCNRVSDGGAPPSTRWSYSSWCRIGLETLGCAWEDLASEMDVLEEQRTIVPMLELHQRHGLTDERLKEQLVDCACHLQIEEYMLQEDW